MKRIKIAMAALLVTAGLVASFAFTNKSAHKPVDIRTYYFTADHKQIPPSQTNTLQHDEVVAGANWTESNPGYTFGTGDYLAAITFDQEQLSKSEAISGVWTSYAAQNPDDLPTDGNTITVVKGGNNYTVTIRRKSSN
jgi:hypothetical protein